MPDLRIALLGYGAIAAEHARAFTALGCSLVAVMGPKAESARAFAEEHGAARATVALEEVLGAADVDAVVVASPNDAHADQAVAALEAGKHVLCEVPLALSAAEAERVARAAAAAGTSLMVCHTQRFWRPVAHLRRLVEDGRLDVQHVVSRTGLFRRENVGWTGRRRSWTDSVVWHHGSHAVDTALWLLDDEVDRVGAELGRRHPDTGLPMDVSIAIRSRSGALASLVLSYNSRLAVGDVLVIGEQDTFRLEGGTLAGSEGAVLESDGAAEMQDDAIRTQNDTFVRSVCSGEPAEPTAAGVLPVYRVLQRVDDLLSARP
jgi:2-hydroxy-4-carboxymuconate semialdehyde hemiacetal dehydrogenase